ncbi:MAG: (d)CMP kinase [Gemmatimonadetes bacterium]|nr:(d)CMP kinase [Gemmatimonadota bacterium]
MIIAIDGPAGSGKSSTARAVAERMDLRHLDSGAFYRALTHAALRAGVPPDRWPGLGHADLDALQVHGRPAERGFHLYAREQDITGALRSAEVNANVSHMARVPAVRGWLLERLREAARGTDLVADGRDMGTVVFPNAELKIFLIASPETRARRRLAEQGVEAPGPDELAAEVRRLLERDRIDSEREVGPLRRAPDAIPVDTTLLTFDQQVEQIVRLAAQRMGQDRDARAAGSE